MIVIFYTPFLGTFNTFHHSLLSKIEPGPHTRGSHTDRIFKHEELSNPLRAVKLSLTYDIMDNNSTNFMDYIWYRFYVKDDAEFFQLPATIRIIPVVLCIIHIIVSNYIVSLCFKTTKMKDIAYNSVKGLWTMVCPPLFFDWEELWHHNSELSFKSCWEKCHYIFVSFVLLVFFEHLILCVPLVAFKVQ